MTHLWRNDEDADRSTLKPAHRARVHPRMTHSDHTSRSTRRRFLQSTAALGAAASLPVGWPAIARSLTPTHEKLRILILGGTGFIGPHIVERALERGHEVTLFNRGRTNPHLFPELEKLRGDRDPDEGSGLESIRAEVESGRTWDAIIDTSAYVPRIANASASLLAPASDRYIIVSSVSVYADQSKKGITEDDPVATIEDEASEEMGDNYENYGALKALCEKAAFEAYDGRATLIRPGFIVGPRDGMPQRFNLWVARISAGGERIAPGSPDDPVQFIDARDLANFIIHCAEEETFGPFNIVGPKDTLTIEKMIDGLVAGTEAEIERVWVPADFLESQGHSGSFIPWLPAEGDFGGLSTVSNARAVKAGLRFRSVADTARDTHAWLESVEDDDPVKRRMLQLLNSGAEQELIDAWRSKDG